MKKIEEMFEEMKSKDKSEDQTRDKDVVFNVETIAAGLKTNPDDISMLILAWALKSSSVGEFSRKEWVGGLTQLEADSWELLRNRIGELREEISKNQRRFKEFYDFVFEYGLSIRDVNGMKNKVSFQLFVFFLLFFQMIIFNEIDFDSRNSIGTVEISFERAISALRSSDFFHVRANCFWKQIEKICLT